MAVIKRLGGYLGNALDRACDLVTHGVVLVEHTHQPVIYHIPGTVLDHADLLPDYALLLAHRLVGEVGGGHKS